MKAVILAGGYGTRLAEETNVRPKPMIELGGKPIIWHIMKIYSAYGINDFIICLGYMGYVIKEYFANYVLHNSHVTIDTQKNQITYHSYQAEPWKVTLVDTGIDTMTGGRLKQIRHYLDQHDTFCLTYGDGLSDVNIKDLITFHKEKKKKATLVAVKPSGRFGATLIEGELVRKFIEKPLGESGYINGGFFVLEPEVIDLIADDTTIWEREPLETLAETKELAAYLHNGFWQPMDTLREKQLLEQLWTSGNAPWCVWSK